MRHLVALPVVAALTLTGALGGCAQLGLPSLDAGTVATDTAAFVQEVQTLTTAACGFVPSAETIAGLATAGNAGAGAALTLASSIAAVVCGTVKALPTSTAAAGGATKLRAFSRARGDVLVGRARGVPVVGHFR